MSGTGHADAAASMCNLRDLGGLATTCGRRTRHGILYRSDVPLAGDGIPSTVAIWPPATVLDLRSPRELRLAPNPLAAAGATVHALPLIDDAGLAGAVADPWPPAAELERWFRTLYTRWVLERPAQIAGAVARAAAAEPPVLVHCAAGRDRTGVVVALLLLAAGVRREAIVADYRRTEPNHASLMARLAAGRALPQRSGDDRLRDAALATPAAIADVLDIVTAHPGGVAGWLGRHGVMGHQMSRWRELLVEDARETCLRASRSV